MLHLHHCFWVGEKSTSNFSALLPTTKHTNISPESTQNHNSLKTKIKCYKKMRLESWNRLISYYQGAWRLPFRIKDKPAEYNKEFQHNYTIHSETRRKTTHTNYNRKIVSLKSLRIFMIGQTHKQMITVRFMFCPCCCCFFYLNA